LKPSDTEQPVLIYDGTCGLCNSSVDFVLRHDRAGRIRLAASQSESGTQLVQQFWGAPDVDKTILLVHGGKIHARSDAVFLILRFLPLPWPVLGVFRLVPRSIRDWIYGVISKNRHKWFGSSDVCRISVKGFEDRFLP